GVDHRDTDADVLREADLRAGLSTGPDRLHGEAMAEHGVVPHLLQLGIRKPESRRSSDVQLLPTANLDVEPLVAALDERGELVDREVVLHAVAEWCRGVAGIVGKGFRRVFGLPAAVLVL